MERSTSCGLSSSFASPSAATRPRMSMPRAGSCTLLAPEVKPVLQHEQASSNVLHLRRSLDLGGSDSSSRAPLTSLMSAASVPLESASRVDSPTLLGMPVVAYQPPKELAFNRRAQQKALEQRKKPVAAKKAALDANSAFLLRRAQRVAQERSSMPLTSQGIGSAYANA